MLSLQPLVNLVNRSLPTKRINIFGKNSLLMSSLPYYLMAVLTLIAYKLIWTHAWVFFFIVYTLIPLFDEIFSLDDRNPTEQERKQLIKNDIYFRIGLYVAIVLDWAFFFKTLHYISHFDPTPYNCFNLVALGFLMSNLNAIQFNIAHELFHKERTIDRIMGTLHMSKNLYMHFTYEHIFGHHRRVSTPQDAASARKDQDVYGFVVRSFLASYKSVYEMEKEAKKPFYLNYSVLSVVGAIAFTAGVFAYYPFHTGLFFFFEATFSIFFLEAINYLEHFGLQRQKLPNGEYEKVTIRHSWNAPHRITNYLLFKLQRHSDHHQNATKPYQTLLSLDESPQLPHGYAVCILMTFFPRVWHKIMDPLVEQYQKNKTGNVVNLVTMKAQVLTREFTIRLSLCLLGMMCLSLVLRHAPLQI